MQIFTIKINIAPKINLYFTPKLLVNILVQIWSDALLFILRERFLAIFVYRIYLCSEFDVGISCVYFINTETLKGYFTLFVLPVYVYCMFMRTKCQFFRQQKVFMQQLLESVNKVKVISCSLLVLVSRLCSILYLYKCGNLAVGEKQIPWFFHI